VRGLARVRLAIPLAPYSPRWTRLPALGISTYASSTARVQGAPRALERHMVSEGAIGG
jgi:hypothetical protein